MCTLYLANCNMLAGCFHRELVEAVCVSSVCFLANYMLSPVRLSVVCNARAPYSGGSYYRHPQKILRRSYQGNPSAKGVAKYSDFGPIEGCISETVQDRR